MARLHAGNSTARRLALRERQLKLLYKLTGNKQLDKKLRAMGDGASAIARRAVMKAIRVIEKAQKSAAPTRRFKKGIGARALKKRDREIGAKAGLNVGKRRFRRKLKSGRFQKANADSILHLLLLGTKRRYATKLNKLDVKLRGRRNKLGGLRKKIYRGQVKPMRNNFIRSATRGSLKAAATVAAGEAWKLIKEKAAK